MEMNFCGIYWEEFERERKRERERVCLYVKGVTRVLMGIAFAFGKVLLGGWASFLIQALEIQLNFLLNKVVLKS